MKIIFLHYYLNTFSYLCPNQTKKQSKKHETESITVNRPAHHRHHHQPGTSPAGRVGLPAARKRPYRPAERYTAAGPEWQEGGTHPNRDIRERVLFRWRCPRRGGCCL